MPALSRLSGDVAAGRSRCFAGDVALEAEGAGGQEGEGPCAVRSAGVTTPRSRIRGRPRTARRSGGAVSAPPAVRASRRSRGCNSATSWWSRKTASACPSIATSCSVLFPSRCANGRSARTGSTGSSTRSRAGWRVPVNLTFRPSISAELVMEALAGLDQVAYVRFASVYKNFREAKDFEQFLGSLGEREEEAAVEEVSDSAADHRWMKAALALGRRGLGGTAPNPSVGCILVNDGRVVGRGWTWSGGRPHAEAEALRRAGTAARGATAYVTLEPCAHYGRTPPCADALIEAGVARVAVALDDPDGRVAGSGLVKLAAAGIVVDSGVCAEPAMDDLGGYLMRQRTGRPRFSLKLATSLDGRIATAGGDSRWITGPLARARWACAACDPRRRPDWRRHRSGGRSAADLPFAGGRASDTENRPRFARPAAGGRPHCPDICRSSRLAVRSSRRDAGAVAGPPVYRCRRRGRPNRSERGRCNAPERKG